MATKMGKYIVLKSNLLENMKLAFMIESEKKIYVSPTVYSLIGTDAELIKKHLKVIKMPVKMIVSDKAISSIEVANPNPSEVYENLFTNLEEWVNDLKSKSTDLYCETKSNMDEVKK